MRDLRATVIKLLTCLLSLGLRTNPLIRTFSLTCACFSTCESPTRLVLWSHENVFCPVHTPCPLTPLAFCKWLSILGSLFLQLCIISCSSCKFQLKHNFLCEVFLSSLGQTKESFFNSLRTLCVLPVVEHFYNCVCVRLVMSLNC